MDIIIKILATLLIVALSVLVMSLGIDSFTEEADKKHSLSGIIFGVVIIIYSLIILYVGVDLVWGFTT